MAGMAEPTDLASVVSAHLSESAETKRRFLEEGGAASVVAAARLCAEALESGGKVLFCGNGGSAGDSQHLATELVVRLSASRERRALAAIALTTDTSLLTAAGNDYGFDRIFARQVEALGRAGDVLVGISTSGRSRNVVAAFETARELGMKTVVLSAGDGAALAGLADASVLVPATACSHIQETHITCGHVLCDVVERILFDGAGA